MGVSLERVQFKFASIIGELCSEPVVLSQFAVWLDLRLAEYKSKGAISLDCSGEKPDPSWLKGLRAAAAPVVKRVLGSRLAPRTGVGFSRGGMYSRSNTIHRRNINSHGRLSHTGLAQQSHSQQNTQSDINSRLSEGEVMGTAPEHLSENSDDVVVIKDEPSGDSPSAVYPVSLHSHQSDEPDSRKRPARDSVSSDTQDNSNTPYKIRKTPTDDSPLNQSLMSVLGSTFEDQNPDVANNSSINEMDYSVSLQDQTGDSANFQSWADNSANFQSSGPHTSSTSTFSPNPRASASATVTSNSSLAEGSISTDTEQAEANVQDGSQAPQDGRKQAVWEKLWARVGLEAPQSSLTSVMSVRSPAPPSHSKMSAENLRRRERIKVDSRPRTTVNYMIAAVGTFERWLWAISPEERREIFEIPPEELDSFLVDFFATVKKPCGGQYNPESFISLRSRLDSYLKDNDYPCSITKSELFAKSQLSFKLRKQELKEAHAESMQ